MEFKSCFNFLRIENNLAIFVNDDAFFQLELGCRLRASLGRTEIASGLNWRIPDRLG